MPGVTAPTIGDERRVGFVRGGLAVALLGCAPGPDAQAPTADEFLLSLEQRWLDEESVHLEFDVLSEGAFEADLEGRLRWGEGDAVELSAEGTFGPDPVTLSLSVEDDRLVGGNAAGHFDEPLPAELREALVIGLTRMGVLHNLARLVSST